MNQLIGLLIIVALCLYCAHRVIVDYHKDTARRAGERATESAYERALRDASEAPRMDPEERLKLLTKGVLPNATSHEHSRHQHLHRRLRLLGGLQVLRQVAPAVRLAGARHMDPPRARGEGLQGLLRHRPRGRPLLRGRAPTGAYAPAGALRGARQGLAPRLPIKDHTMIPIEHYVTWGVVTILACWCFFDWGKAAGDPKGRRRMERNYKRALKHAALDQGLWSPTYERPTPDYKARAKRALLIYGDLPLYYGGDH